MSALLSNIDQGTNLITGPLVMHIVLSPWLVQVNYLTHTITEHTLGNSPPQELLPKSHSNKSSPGLLLNCPLTLTQQAFYSQTLSHAFVCHSIARIHSTYSLLHTAVAHNRVHFFFFSIHVTEKILINNNYTSGPFHVQKRPRANCYKG